METETSGRRETCYRVAQTLSVMWSLFMVGISDSLLGPSMLDLQALLQVDLGHLNYIVMATGLVDFLGAVLAGFLARTAGVDIRIVVSLFFGSVAIAISAAMPNYYYVLVAFSMHGFLRGIVYCYSIEKCNGIWTNKGVSFQLVGLGPTIGGAVSPLLINLFLCEKKRSTPLEESFDTIDTWNQTQASYHYNSTSINDTSHDSTCLPEDIKISYAYIVLGLMCLPPVLAFFVFWFKSRKLKKKRGLKTKPRTLNK